MAFITDKKRVIGLGSAGTGTAHHWAMTVSSYALIILVPLFIITFGRALGKPYDEVVAHFARPYPAIITALTFIVGFTHFKNGVRVLIEDYVHGYAREAWIIAMTLLSYAAMATGLFAIGKIAL